MTRKSPKSARPTLFLAFAIAAAAVLAFAAPASAHHHHGRHHHRHHHRFFHSQGGDAAGTIASFDQTTGKLTIDLTDGNSVSGTVTEDTWIDCGSGCDHHGWFSSGDPQQLHSWDSGDWNDPGSSCSTADLVPGATVQDAVLVLADGHATFVKVELAPSP